jgi:mannitol/fructose-specific phosphotransferase system IIA component (Ntr-type)
MRWAGATQRLRVYLGPALLPQAGLAVGLMLLVTEDAAFAPIAEQRDLFLAVVLTAVLLNEIVGPLVTRWALRRSGDFGKDRARLIDFLHEEHIVTGLEAPTPAVAIEKLTDHLVRTHALGVGRDQLLAAFLARENAASTCLGRGLAIPHGHLASGDTLVGVMGISRDGLSFDTPDGLPVHCVVLLATPAQARGRHLEVLAAFAQVIKDRNIRQQLYRAKSPAHAYELLHADEESEDFNYFLDEDEENAEQPEAG